MKFDWYPLIGFLCILAFLVTRWSPEAFLNGFGLALGFVGIGILGVSIGAKLSAKKKP
ncbi:hypothetical protein [Microbacterium maritypicum]